MVQENSNELGSWSSSLEATGRVPPVEIGCGSFTEKTIVLSASFVQRPWERNSTDLDKLLCLADYFSTCSKQKLISSDLPQRAAGPAPGVGLLTWGIEGAVADCCSLTSVLQ